jgi:hypothetical protein
LAYEGPYSQEALLDHEVPYLQEALLVPLQEALLAHEVLWGNEGYCGAGPVIEGFLYAWFILSSFALFEALQCHLESNHDPSATP